MNQIMMIFPTLKNGVWAFDDEATGLVQEPFVAGMSEIISAWAGAGAKNLTVLFSAHEFPGARHRLTWMFTESGGNWYRDAQTDSVGWLCPALFLYFDNAPKTIFVQIHINDEVTK